MTKRASANIPEVHQGSRRHTGVREYPFASNVVREYPFGEYAVGSGWCLWYSPHAMNASDARLRWAEISRRRVASCAVFDLYATERESRDGRHGEFWLLSTPDWVNVVPLLRSADGEARFIMVRQFRHGAGTITTEFPAGLVERGEDPRAAAARELLEETGYRAGTLTPLGKVQPNPAFMGNWCHCFLAEDLTLEGGGSPDEMELIEAIAVPVPEVEARMGTGEYVNALALVALELYHRAIAERV